MRSNVESRRCGCGVILSLRESCKACADKARARLHADGIATMRGQEHCKHPTEHFDLSWDKCGLCGIELRKVRQEIQEKRFEAARYEARTQRLAWYRRIWSADEAAEYKPMPEHIRHELDALRQSGKITTLSTPATLTERQCRMFGDGHAMEPPPAPHGFQLHGLRGARFGAVGSLDEWAAGGLEAWTRSQSYEPPPVGAEVTWEVAECHMRRDEKARYSAKRSYRSEYAIREGRLVLCDAKDGDWWPVYAVPSGEWVRLA